MSTTLLASEHIQITPLSLAGEVLRAAIFFAFGVVLIRTGIKEYNTGRLISNTPTQKVRSLAPGRAELEGKAVASENGTVPRPFSEGTCLCGKYKIEERRRRRSKKGNRYKWVTIDSGFIGNPFYIEDETGRVLVETEDLSLKVSSENRNTTTVGAGRTPPKPIQEFRNGDVTTRDLASENTGLISTLSPFSSSGGGFSVGGRKLRRRRYKEWFLPAGEDAYVFGAATERADQPETAIETEKRLKMTKDDSTGRFIVTDRCQDALATSLKRYAPLYMVVGVALSGAGLYFLLTTLIA